jgi:hypothetical protein
VVAAAQLAVLEPAAAGGLVPLPLRRHRGRAAAVWGSASGLQIPE